MARRAYAISKRTQYLARPESKYIQNTATTTITNSGTSIFILNAPTLGTDAGNRIGREVSFKSVQLKLVSTINASASASLIRFILFVDKQANGGAAPSATDLLEAGPTPYYAVTQLNNRRRFSIIRDWTVPLSINGDRIKVTNRFVKISVRTIYDNSTVGNETDISTGAIYLMALGNEGINLPTLNITARLRYYDA